MEAVVNLLSQKKDMSWLRSRSIVITYEECWPLGLELKLDKSVSSKIETLLHVAMTEKNKEATGLGTLAYAFSEGDTSVLAGDEKDKYIKIIAEAIRRPKDFWEWLNTKSDTNEKAEYIKASRKYIASATWPWDKAFIQAASYLAIINGVPNTQPAPIALGYFPFWVALDKHTPQGKKALKIIAKEFQRPYRDLLWISFYLESSKTNASTASFWWNREVSWRLKKIGVSINEAEDLWSRIAPVLAMQLSEEAAKLEAVVCSSYSSAPVGRMSHIL